MLSRDVLNKNMLNTDMLNRDMLNRDCKVDTHSMTETTIDLSAT